MATRKEQLAAGEFARRRVLGALLRPGGGPAVEEPPRPLRTMFLAASGLAVALGVAALIGYLHPADPGQDWRKGLIKDSAGTSYVLVAGRLHQVADQSSVRLILGPNAVTSTRSDQELASLKNAQGPVIGLSGVPDPLPKAADLDVRDWKVCVTPEGRMVATVGYGSVGSGGPGTLTGSSALLARDPAGRDWIVEGGMKYQVADRQLVLGAFGAHDVVPRSVPAAWLGGLGDGDPLGLPRVPGTFGNRTGHHAPSGFDRVGMFGRSAGPAGAATHYLVGADGLLPVSATEYELYQREPRLAANRFTEQKLAPGAVTPDMLAASPDLPSWPADPPRFGAAQNPQAPGSAVLCAAFDGSFDQQGNPRVQVSVGGGMPGGTAIPASSQGSAAIGQAAPAAVSVRRGHAALVRDAGTDAATATCYLLTDAGVRYQLVGAAASRLGYDGVACAEVPGEWLRLVPVGVPLDPSRATQPVTRPGSQGPGETGRTGPAGGTGEPTAQAGGS